MITVYLYDIMCACLQRKRERRIGLLSLSLLLLLAGSWIFFPPAMAHAQTTHQIQLESVKMFDARHGWALEKNRTRVLATDRGPEDWSNVTPSDFVLPGADQENSVTSSFFLDAHHGYLGVLQDGKTSLWMTKNRGRTWTSVSFDFQPFTNVSIYQIEFLDARHGWLAFDTDHGFGHYHIILMSTNDGGKTWHQLLNTIESPNGLPIQGLKNFHFTSTQSGWVTGPEEETTDVRLYETHDGGKTWVKASIPPVTLPPSATDPYTQSQGPYFSDARHATLVVTFSALFSKAISLTTYQTTDGGRTWKAGPTITSIGITSFRENTFMGAYNGWVLGVNPERIPVLQSTKDGGQHWHAILPTGLRPFTEVILSLTFLNPMLGWTVNKDDNDVTTLFQTVDGGTHWQSLRPMIR